MLGRVRAGWCQWHPPWTPPCCRESQALSVRGESIPEDRFCRSLCRAVGMWPGARLVDYVCVESALLGESPQELSAPKSTAGTDWGSADLPTRSGAGGCRQL